MVGEICTLKNQRERTLNIDELSIFPGSWRCRAGPRGHDTQLFRNGTEEIVGTGEEKALGSFKNRLGGLQSAPHKSQTVKCESGKQVK